MKEKTIDWVLFATLSAGLTALHVATAFAAGYLPSVNAVEGVVFYAVQGMMGPLCGLIYVGLRSAALRPPRPGRSATKVAIVLGVIFYLSELRSISVG